MAKVCQNVLITNCLLGDRNFACVGIGSETSGGIRECARRALPVFLHSGSWAVYIKTRKTGPERAGTIMRTSRWMMWMWKIRTGRFLHRHDFGSGNARSTPNDTVEGDVGIPQGRNFQFTNIRLHDMPAALANVAETSLSSVKPSRRAADYECQQGLAEKGW